MVHSQYYNVHCGTLDFTPGRELWRQKQALVLSQVGGKEAKISTHQILIGHQFRDLTL